MIDGLDLSKMLAPLFTPLEVNGVRLKNRFVMPAMQRGWCEDGRPLPELADYYGRRAAGGVALVISESCAVDHHSASAQAVACRLDASTSLAWERCINAVHEGDGLMLIQLWHEGGLRDNADGLTLSPSGLGHPNLRQGRAATAADLDQLVDAYVRSAVIARDIGADGVELHCAHGFLLDQFLWEATNRREDLYGGSAIEARAAFPSRILRAIRAACGDGFLISVRFSQWKEHDFTARIAPTRDDLDTLLGLFSDAGADMFHASTRRFWLPEWTDSPRSLAGWTKDLSGKPTIAVGSVGLDRDVMQSFSQEGEAGGTMSETIERLVSAIARDEFDMIAVGRSLIADPDWVRKVESGRFDSIRLFRKEDIAAVDWQHD